MVSLPCLNLHLNVSAGKDIHLTQELTWPSMRWQLPWGRGLLQWCQCCSGLVPFPA